LDLLPSLSFPVLFLPLVYDFALPSISPPGFPPQLLPVLPFGVAKSSSVLFVFVGNRVLFRSRLIHFFFPPLALFLSLIGAGLASIPLNIQNFCSGAHKVYCSFSGVWFLAIISLGNISHLASRCPTVGVSFLGFKQWGLIPGFQTRPRTVACSFCHPKLMMALVRGFSPNHHKALARGPCDSSLRPTVSSVFPFELAPWNFPFPPFRGFFSTRVGFFFYDFPGWASSPLYPVFCEGEISLPFPGAWHETFHRCPPPPPPRRFFFLSWARCFRQVATFIHRSPPLLVFPIVLVTQPFFCVISYAFLHPFFASSFPPWLRPRFGLLPLTESLPKGLPRHP